MSIIREIRAQRLVADIREDQDVQGSLEEKGIGFRPIWGQGDHLVRSLEYWNNFEINREEGGWNGYSSRTCVYEFYTEQIHSLI